MQKNLTTPLYKLSFYSKEMRVFEGNVHTLTAPGEMGYLQILARHAPIIALLKAGSLSFVDSNQQKHAYTISGGVLEVSHGEATLLIDSIL